MNRDAAVSLAHRSRLSGIAIILTLGLLLSGCGSSETAEPVETPTAIGLPADATANDILAFASERLAETTSAAFKLTVDGDTFVDPMGVIKLLSAKGNLLRPDRVATEFKVSIAGRTVTLSLITIGDRTWMTDIVKGEWGPAPIEFAYRPDVLFDTQSGLGPVMGRVSDATREADEEIDGQPVFHVTADVSADVVGPMTYYTLKGDPVKADIWVSQATGDMLRARLTEPPGPDRPNPATWTLDVNAHGEPVVIEAPIADEPGTPAP